MGTDCGLLIKIKGEDRKYYQRTFDRLYCFEHISIGPNFELEHAGLKDGNPLIDGRRYVRTTDEITLAHGLRWAEDRIAFLTTHRQALEKDDTAVSYHLHWVTDFLQALQSIREWDNIETLWLAADNGETYDDIVFEDKNEVIDLEA